MRINCHAHIFNLYSVFTEETVHLLLGRLNLDGLPKAVQDEVARILKKALKKGAKGADGRALLEEMLRRLGKSAGLKKALDDLAPEVGLQFRLLDDDLLSTAGAEFLGRLMKKIGAALFDPEADARAKFQLGDIIDYLATALQPDIKSVAARLLGELEPDDAIVALMMDITAGGEADKTQFQGQIDGTSGAVLAFPGRILPFVAVNTTRGGHFDLMERALTAQGFVGVKLYPSLGYSVNSPEMARVFGYCAERQVPVLMHCSEGGFPGPEDARQNSAPRWWDDILREHEGLKICFGHFGGDRYLVQPEIDSHSWTGEVLRLMKEHEGVYADVAYHDAPMAGGGAEENYFRNLRNLLDDPVWGKRIVFGTDFYMVRVVLSEKSFWEYFERRIDAGGGAHFRALTQDNPATFLGLPSAGVPGAWPIRNYLAFLVRNRDRVKAAPSEWALRAVAQEHGDVEFQDTILKRWSENNDAHFYLQGYLRQQLKPSMRGLSFKETGGVRLHELRYWRKEFASSSEWQDMREHMFVVVDGLFQAKGAKYETGYDFDKARQHLMKALDDGQCTIAELGETCDGLYRFRSEAGGA